MIGGIGLGRTLAGVICDACRESEHERCPGGSWCDCQHRPPGPVEPVTGPPGE